jgi:hypothetical protein
MNKLFLISLLGLFSCVQKGVNEIKVAEPTIFPSAPEEPLEDVVVSIHFSAKGSRLSSLEKGRIIANFKDIKEKEGDWRITGYTNNRNNSLVLKRCRVIQYYLKKNFNAQNLKISIVKLSPSIHTDQVEVVFHPHD